MWSASARKRILPRKLPAAGLAATDCRVGVGWAALARLTPGVGVRAAPQLQTRVAVGKLTVASVGVIAAVASVIALVTVSGTVNEITGAGVTTTRLMGIGVAVPVVCAISVAWAT